MREYTDIQLSRLFNEIMKTYADRRDHCDFRWDYMTEYEILSQLFRFIKKGGLDVLDNEDAGIGA